jgi:cyclopropane fatty-acyl-phospholipid synthase-like methyltransferase
MDPHPWDYLREVTSRLDGVTTLLDLGTGDGQLLASMAPRPSLTAIIHADW